MCRYYLGRGLACEPRWLYVAKQSEPAFKDFYHVLQIQQDADSVLVDRAYWHLARLCNTTAGPWAKEKLDELNEAYSVLRSPALREAYDKLRDGVLGAHATPAVPKAAPTPPPLHVMSRQPPQPVPTSGPATAVSAKKGKSLPKLSWPRRSRKARQPKQQAPEPPAGHDLNSLFKATEDARRRWRASIDDPTPSNGTNAS
jgi:curved DNA-binding protein CbpA